MTTGHEHSSLNLFHCDREVVTKRGWFLNYRIGCFERWCLALDCFLWKNMFVSCLSVLPLPSCLARGCVQWLPCRQGWLEDLWDSFIDLSAVWQKQNRLFRKALAFILARPPLFLLPNKAHVVEVTCCCCPSSCLQPVFCGSALILGNFFLQPGNFLSSVWCAKQMDAGYRGNNREVCFGRICGT